MPSKKQSIFILLILLVVALTSFSWGVMTMYRKVFPYELVRSAAFAVLGSRASAPKPRISFFEEFVTKADVVMIGDSIPGRRCGMKYSPTSGLPIGGSVVTRLTIF